VSKYGNKKTEIDGHLFDSKKEGLRYQTLKRLEETGEIDCLELQPEYVVQESFKRNGKTHRAIKVRLDFRYIEDKGLIVEDFKGMLTDVYKLKKKLFLNYVEREDLELTFRESVYKNGEFAYKDY